MSVFVAGAMGAIGAVSGCRRSEGPRHDALRGKAGDALRIGRAVSNAGGRREFAGLPAHPSWREGFVVV